MRFRPDQAWRQSSVNGGGREGRAEKIFGGTDKLFLKFRREDQKKFSSQICAPSLRGGGGGGGGGARLQPGRTRRNLMMRISIPANNFRG